MPPLQHLLELASQDPTGAVFEVLDKGPLGLAAILLLAIAWLFKFKEKQIETMRKDHRVEFEEIRKEQKADRDENKNLLREATAATVENTELMRQVVALIDKLGAT